jgi:hypothetical protein
MTIIARNEEIKKKTIMKIFLNVKCKHGFLKTLTFVSPKSHI